MTFNSGKAVNQYLVQFFADKNGTFYARGIIEASQKMAQDYQAKWAIYN